MNKELGALTRMSGIGAIFVRGFVEYFHSQPDRPVALRKCQEAGMQCVADIAEDTISVPYMGKLAKAVDAAKVTHRSKQGRSFYLSDNDNLDAFLVWLEENPDYGTRLKGNADEDNARIQMFNLLQDCGSIRANSENLIPAAAYRKLNEMVAQGNLEVVFVKAGLPMGVKYRGTTVRPPFYPVGDDD